MAQRPKSAGPASQELIQDLVYANRILSMHGVVDGFGHVSVRHDKHPERFLLSRRMAPELVTPDDLMELDLNGEVCEGDERTAPVELYIHSEAYRARPDVQGVVHSHSPEVIPFGVTGTPLRAVFHMAGFLGEGAPVFEIRDTAGPATDMLVRTAALGKALAETLGDHTVALMRGHGSVVVGQSIRHAVMYAVYAQVGARIQMEAMRLGPVTYLTAEEARNITEMNDSIVFKNWDLWVHHMLQQGRGV